LSSREVKAPESVRYAWASAPESDLFNRSGLPAAPFRTSLSSQGEKAR
jgi:sialate O-acetylesterase